MKKLSLLLAVLVCVSSARADWVIVQKASMEGVEKELTTKIKGDHGRVDMGEQTTMIVSMTGVMMLMHSQKLLMKVDDTATRMALGIQDEKPDATGKDRVAKPVSTGQKEKVGEWAAEIYTWKGTMGEGRFWVVKDFPKFAEINTATDKLGRVLRSVMAGMSPQMSDFPGMVVRSEFVAKGKTSITTLVSAKEQDVDAKEFTAPEGYNEMKMPAMPGGAPK